MRAVPHREGRHAPIRARAVPPYLRQRGGGAGGASAPPTPLPRSDAASVAPEAAAPAAASGATPTIASTLLAINSPATRCPSVFQCPAPKWVLVNPCRYT